MRFLIILLGLFLYLSTPTYADGADDATVVVHSYDAITFDAYFPTAPTFEVQETVVRNYTTETSLCQGCTIPFYTGVSPPVCLTNYMQTTKANYLSITLVKPYIEPMFFRLCA